MHPKKQLRRVATASLAAVSLVALAGCAGGADSSGPTEITFSYLWAGPEAEVLEGLISQFNASQSEVVVKGVSSPDTAAQLAALSGSRAQFDVSDHFDDSVGTWVDQGLLADLTPMIEADGYDLTDFVAGSMDPLTVDGKVYSLPLATYTNQLVYNKDLLAEAGIQPPTTFEELVAAGRALTKTDGDRVTRLGFAPLDIRTMTWAAGGEWVDGGKPAPTAAQVETAAGLYMDQIQGLNIDAVKSFVASFGDYWSADNPFYTGQFAMTLDGPWHAAMTKQYAPDFNWGVAPIPVPADQPQLAGIAPLKISTIFIPQNSEKKEAAWKFVKFMMSPEALVTFNTQLANIPPRVSLASDPALADLGENYLSFVRLQNSGTLKTFPAAPWVVGYNTLIADTQKAIYEGTVPTAEGVAQLVSGASGLAR